MGKQSRLSPQQAREAIEKYGGLRPAARALGVDNGFLCRVAKRSGGIPAESVAAGSIADSPRTKAVKTLADFRQAYDKDTIVPAKIRAGLSILGPDGWEYEVEFAKMCGISLYDMGRVRDKFADHVVSVNRNTKRAWAGSKSLASKMKEMI